MIWLEQIPYRLRAFFNVLLCVPLIGFAGCSRLASENMLDQAKQYSDVPEWAKSAVWYQIFPERFRNGDPSNDPKLSDIIGSWPQEVPKDWNVSNWTGDWYELQPWEVPDNKGFYFRVQQRRYGGDLQGVMDKLDYLQDLGVTAIYFNPLFESPSLHKYDATMYHHIDNNFGPDPEGDRKIWESENPGDPSTWKWTSADKLFLKLIEELHKRDMKIIIDGVFNHVGMTFWAFEDVKKNGSNSLYKDWFVIKSYDDPKTPANEFEYEGWYGVRELPEIRENENGLVPGPREHVRHIVQRWMDPNGDGDPSDGIDGWRLDVAEMVAMPFWKDFRKWVREIHPEAYLVGEVWWEDYKNEKMFNAEPWLKGDVFDAVMNYRWAREAFRFFNGQKTKTSATDLDQRTAALRGDYRDGVNRVLMNLFDSHDTDRLSSHIVNVDSKYDNQVGANDNPAYDVRKPNAEEIQTQKLMAMYQLTSLGAPTIYYGTEAGMWGGDDPDERKPMLWDDMTFQNESRHPRGNARPNDKNEFNKVLFDHYKKLIGIRRANPAFALGSFQTLVTDDANDVYVFGRKLGNEIAVVALNNAKLPRTVTIPLLGEYGGRSWKNIWSDAKAESTSSQLKIVVPSKNGIILKAVSQ